MTTTLHRGKLMLHARMSLPLLNGDGEAVARAFLELCDRHLDGGRLRIVRGGAASVVGLAGGEAGTLVVHDSALFGRVLAFGNLGLGEAFMDGDFTVDDGRLPEVLTLLARSRLDRVLRHEPRLVATALWLRALHARQGRRKNIRSHYDLGNDLFASFLDSTLTYSCGYARSDDDDIEALQQQKLERICQKLRLRPGERLLDLGCGFGGLLLHAARHHGVTGVGYTLSPAQADEARRRAEAAGLASRVEFRLASAYDARGRFDKVATVGMLEHFQVREYPRIVAHVRELLVPDGLALFHFMGCGYERNTRDPFTQKYLFPGSNQPTLGQIAVACERAELAVLDVENLIRHYAITARRWLERFLAARPGLDARRYDARFQRMWEYYLSLGVAASSATDGALYQVLVQNGYAAPRPFQRV
jgi:cyclopropane-fatty-acyl-phospholipid synthase